MPTGAQRCPRPGVPSTAEELPANTPSLPARLAFPPPSASQPVRGYQTKAPCIKAKQSSPGAARRQLFGQGERSEPAAVGSSSAARRGAERPSGGAEPGCGHRRLGFFLPLFWTRRGFQRGSGFRGVRSSPALAANAVEAPYVMGKVCGPKSPKSRRGAGAGGSGTPRESGGSGPAGTPGRGDAGTGRGPSASNSCGFDICEAPPLPAHARSPRISALDLEEEIDFLRWKHP